MYYLLQSSAPSSDPFFSNDMIGVVKLLGLIAAILIPVFWALFHLVFNTLTQRVKTVEDDLSGYGERLGRQETAQTSCTTEIGSIKADMGRQQAEVRQIGISQAKVETKVEEMARQQVELQRDVMAAVTESGRQQTSAMTALQIELAKLTERNKFGDSLSEIADIMRQNMKLEQTRQNRG